MVVSLLSAEGVLATIVVIGADCEIRSVTCRWSKLGSQHAMMVPAGALLGQTLGV